MATINNISGFVTLGSEELQVAGSMTFSATGGPTNLTYGLATTGTAELPWVENISDAGTDYILGFAFRTSDTTVGTTANIVRVLSTSGQILRLAFATDSSGDLIFFDDVAQIATITAPLTDNTWHYIEIYFEKTGNDSWEIFVDDSSVASGSGDDFDDGAALDAVAFDGNSTNDPNWTNIYIISGATAAADRLGPQVVKRYGSTKSSAVPDDGGDNLNVGTWSAALTVPFAGTVQAEYTNAAAGAVDADATNGDPEGPQNDSDVTTNPVAIKGVWRMERSGGGGAAHFGLIGNDSDGAVRTFDFDPPTTATNFNFVSETATIVPTTSEHLRIGFETTGGQDFECYGCAGMVLFDFSAPTPATVTPLHYHRMMR